MFTVSPASPVSRCTLILACFGAVACGAEEAAPPEIVSVSPEIGSRDVDPATTEIRVTFDQDMRKGFSWTGGGEFFPKTTGRPEWVDDRTCRMLVSFEEGKFYRVGVNSTSHRNFSSTEGVPAVFRVIYFVTEGADEETLERLEKPAVKKLAPANDADNVEPTVSELVVTFDRPMGGGRSWTGRRPSFPETTSAPTWNDDMTVARLPVKLEAGTTYSLGLNAPFANNFQSASGVPLEPVEWTFTTRE